jgi:hypothetical protein
MAFADRFNQSPTVWKYHDGVWKEPGVGGRMTPIFPAKVSWQREDTDAFWGPSVHWNTHLNTFVALMNRSCCSPGWPQEGVYATFNSDLSNPNGWTDPVKVLSGVFWYPQVLGVGPGETDSVAGEKARLYVYGESNWELQFSHGDPEIQMVDPEDPDLDPEPQPEPGPEPEQQPEPEPPNPLPPDEMPAPQPVPDSELETSDDPRPNSP